MAYCPPSMLGDLVPVLDAVRTWPGVVERRPGIFYLHRQPFLHFHRGADDGRRADVKGLRGWSQVSLPLPLNITARRAFVRVLKARYAERVGAERVRR